VRHIDTRVYRIKELATGATLDGKLFKNAGMDQPSDFFQKGLPWLAFEKYRALLMSSIRIHKHTFTDMLPNPQ